MDLSHFYAQAFGVYAIIVTSIALIDKKRYRAVIHGLSESGTMRIVAGLGELFLGLIVVLSHNIWSVGWEVVITVFGYLMIMEALTYLLAPRFIKRSLKKVERYYTINVLMSLAIGILLTYIGFFA